MKNLLLITLLFTSMSCMGQALGRYTYDGFDTLNLKDYTYREMVEAGDLIFMEPLKHAIYQSWLNDQYLEYCYADSTAVEYDIYEYDGRAFKRFPSIDPGFSPGYIGRKIIYEHKQPTFEEYAKWLKNLLK